MKTHFLGYSPLLVLLACILAVSAVGCASCKPGKSPGLPLAYNLKLVPGDSLKDSSVVVDVIGVNPSELPKWQNYSLKKYWKAGDPVRQDAAKFTTSFVPGEQKTVVLKKTDPIWDKWLKAGVQDLVVLADLPGAFEEGKVGSQDPRRQLLPLCKCYWPDKTEELTVKVQAGGVSLGNTPREGWTLPAW